MWKIIPNRPWQKATTIDYISFPLSFQNLNAEFASSLGLLLIQCVSLNSPSLMIYIYPEIRATEVTISALNIQLCSFYFRIMKRDCMGEPKETHCIGYFGASCAQVLLHVLVAISAQLARLSNDGQRTKLWAQLEKKGKISYIPAPLFLFTRRVSIIRGREENSRSPEEINFP